MHPLLLLIPDFALILMGWALMRVGSSEFAARHGHLPLAGLGPAFWRGVEQLVYYVMFPALLFYSTNRASFDLHAASGMLLVAALTTLVGIVLGYAARWLLRPEPIALASGVQTAFRFNSYICLAVAGRIAGEQGIALMAVIIGAMVPIANIAAVWGLAHHGERGVWRELARNPLIIATLTGLATNLLGVPLPEILGLLLSRLGAAAIALGLMTVGAGLQFGRLRGTPALVAYWTSVKLLALPATALLLSRWIAMSVTELRILVAFAAMPTASSCYILAVRMGGDGPLVALLVSVMTLGALITLPFWMTVLH